MRLHDIVNTLQNDPFVIKPFRYRHSHVSSRAHFKGGIKAFMKSDDTPTFSKKDGGYNGGAAREAATYQFAQILGLGYLVPPTVLRMVDGKPHSLQLWAYWLSGCESYNAKINYGSPAFRDLLFLDCIIANNDRHQGNFLVLPPNRVRAIDNAYTFPTDQAHYSPKYSNPQSKKPLSRRHIRILTTHLSSPTWKAPLLTLLGEDAVRETENRMQNMLEDRVYV